MEAVSKLCRRVIWLHRGRLKADGTPDSVLSEYLEKAHSRSPSSSAAAPKEWGSREIWFDSVVLRDQRGTVTRTFRRGDKLVIDANVKSRLSGSVDGVLLGFSIHRMNGEKVIATNNLEMNQSLLSVNGSMKCSVEVELDILEPGAYLLGVALTDPVRSRDYHWREFFYPVTLLEERKDPPLKLVKASWKKR